MLFMQTIFDRKCYYQVGVKSHFPLKFFWLLERENLLFQDHYDNNHLSLRRINRKADHRSKKTLKIIIFFKLVLFSCRRNTRQKSLNADKKRQNGLQSCKKYDFSQRVCIFKRIYFILSIFIQTLQMHFRFISHNLTVKRSSFTR